MNNYVAVHDYCASKIALPISGSNIKVYSMFSGSIPALVTPFCDGSFAEKKFRALVDWQIEQGSSALVPCGTTGEASTLSNAEHHRVIEVCIEQAAGQLLCRTAGSPRHQHLLHAALGRRQGDGLPNGRRRQGGVRHPDVTTDVTGSHRDACGGGGDAGVGIGGDPAGLRRALA